MQLKSFKLVSFFFNYSRRMVVLSIVCGVVAGASSAAMMTLINSRMSGTLDATPRSILAFAGFALLVLFSNAASGLLSTRLAHRTSMHLRMFICRKVLATPLRTTEEIGSARILAALMQDIPVIVSAFLRVPGIFISAAIVAGGLVYMGWLSMSMLLLLVGGVIVAVLSYVIPQRRANKYLDAARDQYNDLTGHFRSLTDGAKELKLNHQRSRAFFSEVVEPTALTFQRNNIAGDSIYALLNSWSHVLYFIIMGLIIFALPSVVENVNAQILTGYALTVLYISGPIQMLVGTIPAFSYAAISMRKLEELGLSLAGSDIDEAAAQLEEKTKTGARSWQLLELDGVTHTYYSEREASAFVLGPLALSIRRGEMIFLVGGNGSGKTTFAKLLCGLYIPHSGEIRIDGEPVTDATRQRYRQNFSAVFADFHLFEQLLGINNPDLDEAARSYLVQLQLEHKVEVRDGKLSTTDLSYGQRKRLALLTAYLEDRSFYIFDEWAADQDPFFKEIFYYRILPELKAKGKTVVVISHDDRYYHIADRIIRLENGGLQYDRHDADPVENQSTTRAHV